MAMVAINLEGPMKNENQMTFIFALKVCFIFFSLK